MCSLRDFQSQKCDIILKYLPDEVRQLKAQGEVPQDLQINENNEGPGAVGAGIEFVDANDEEGSEDSSSDSDDDSEEEEGTPNFNFQQKKKM